MLTGTEMLQFSFGNSDVCFVALAIGKGVPCRWSSKKVAQR